jgi:hypothetical protein
MAEPKQAAISDVLEKNLNDISAADFLSALDSGGLSVYSLRVWPEKKKYELYLEPEHYGGIKAGSLIKGIAEKKKVELEKLSPVEDWRWPKRAAREVDFDPRDLLRDPDFIRELAREVAVQLRNIR